MTNKINLRARIEYGKCKQCGEIKEFYYYLSDFSYGERILHTSNCLYHAYVNLIEDNVFDELDVDMKEVLNEYNVHLTIKENAECINRLFGITCDMIINEIIDTSSTGEKCIKCGSDQFENDNVMPIQWKDVELPIITHNKWNALSIEEKRKAIIRELKLLGYIS